MISAAMAVIENEKQRNELAEFYEKNKSKFYAIAFNYLHNKEEAKDAVQEAFLKIADKPDIFFSLSNAKRVWYLCAIVKNVSIDMFNKSRKVQTKELSDNIVFRNDPELLENLVLDDISHKDLIEFIRSLPPLQQNVLILNRLLKLSISETARVLNVSEKAVNQRLYLARKSIRQFVEERRNRNG